MKLHLRFVAYSFILVFFIASNLQAEPVVSTAKSTAKDNLAPTQPLEQVTAQPTSHESACAINFIVVPRSEWSNADFRLEWDLAVLKQALKKYQDSQNLGETRDLLKWAGFGAIASTFSGMAGHTRQTGEDLITYYMRHDPVQVGTVLSASIAVTVLARVIYKKMLPGSTRRSLLRAVRNVNKSLDIVLLEKQGTLPTMVAYANQLRDAAEYTLIEDAMRNNP